MTPEQIAYERGEIYSGPDQQGNYHYALFWLADYHPGHPGGEYRIAERGQHYHNMLPPRKTIAWQDMR